MLQHILLLWAQVGRLLRVVSILLSFQILFFQWAEDVSAHTSPRPLTHTLVRLDVLVAAVAQGMVALEQEDRVLAVKAIPADWHYSPVDMQLAEAAVPVSPGAL